MVGTRDYIPNIVWEKHLPEHQDYTIQKSLVNQDNKSAMNIENNGQRLCGQK